MANLTLELNIDSAKDLENVNLITKMDVYAIVSICGDDTQKNLKVKTPVDHSGGSNPTWNHTAMFSVNDDLACEGRLTLVVKLVCDRVMGDKEIGEVYVPILELLGPTLPSPSTTGSGMKFVTYQVRSPSGKAKGSLTFSYRFGLGSVQSDNPVSAGFSNPANSDLPSQSWPPKPPVSGHPSAPPMLQPDQFGSQYPDSAYPPKPGSLYPNPGQVCEPVSGYPHLPTGSSCDPPPPHQLYTYPPPAAMPGHAYYQGAPPQSYYGYIQQPPPPVHYNFSYPPPRPSGYGYGYGPPPPATVNPQKNKPGIGLGMGLLGGALGGLLIGDIISDIL